MIEQVDALTDILYFTYGSFSLLGVDPTNIFDIVHQANMGKLFPDGQPHYHPVTNKSAKTRRLGTKLCTRAKDSKRDPTADRASEKKS